MRILDPAAADTGGVPSEDTPSRTDPESARLQARIDQLAAHVQQLEQERASLRWMAGHDDLTGLANRRLFHTLAPKLLSDDCSSAVLILDLNGFKPINDTYGHDAGDEVLRVVARRIVDCLGDHLVARFGGDEFAALSRTPRADVPETWWHKVAGSLSAVIASPMHVLGHTLSVTASIGVVPAGRSRDLPDLLRRADQAMFGAKRHAKSTGRAGVTWVVATETGDHTETYDPATVPARPPGSAATVPAPSLGSADPGSAPSPGPVDPGSAPSPGSAASVLAPSLGSTNPGSAPSPGPADPGSAATFRAGDPVWVHRSGARRAGVVEGACEWAALVRYRGHSGPGTMVDTIPTSCLTARADADPYLDRKSSGPDVITAT